MKLIKVYRYVGGFYDCYQEFEWTIEELLKALRVGNIYIEDRLNKGVISELRLPYVRLYDLMEVIDNGNNRE